MKEKFLYTSLLLFSIFCAISQELNSTYYDTTNVRKEFFYDKTLSFKELKDFHELIEDNGRNVGVMFSKWDGGYDMAFYPAYDGKNNYRTYGRIIYRFNKEEKLLFVKVYFIENSDSYILFTNKLSENFEVYLLGKLYRSGLTYHHSIDTLKIMSTYEIFALLDDKNLKKELFISNDDYNFKTSFINSIIIPSLSTYSPDGAINEFNQFVSINTLTPLPPEKQGVNCVGFIKEIFDRYLMILNNSNLRSPVEPLKKRNFSDTDHSRLLHKANEFTHDPFFGRDWIDNLAVLFNTNKLLSDKAIQITSDDFASYSKNRGFNLDDIAPTLFRLQQQSPDSFYILVFNKYDSFSSLIPLYYHTTVVVPYFREKKFILRIFESGEETGFGSLLRNHLPKYFDYKTFTDDLLLKRSDLLNSSEIELLKDSFYLLKNKKGYYFKSSLSDDIVFKLSRIFSKIEYREEKVLLYKIPISHHFLQGEL